MLESFGINQKAWTEQKWFEISKKMRASPYTNNKELSILAEAEHQGKRFYNIGALVGSIFFLAFLKFPMIRVQPGFRRVGLSGIMAYPFYRFMVSLGNQLKAKRIKSAYYIQAIRLGGSVRTTL